MQEGKHIGPRKGTKNQLTQTKKLVCPKLKAHCEDHSYTV